jgi:hypothetical protein
MTVITLFSAIIGVGQARLSIAITRNFASDNNAFTVRLGADEWSMSTADAERLSACGRRLEGALDWAAQHNSPMKLEPYFQRQLGFSDGSASKFEIGLDELGGTAVPYLEWNNKRAIDGSGRLLKVLSIIGEATTTIRQAAASRVQDLRINPETFQSPCGWDGR